MPRCHYHIRYCALDGWTFLNAELECIIGSRHRDCQHGQARAGVRRSLLRIIRSISPAFGDECTLPTILRASHLDVQRQSEFANSVGSQVEACNDFSPKDTEKRHDLPEHPNLKGTHLPRVSAVSVSHVTSGTFCIATIQSHIFTYSL